MNEKLKLEVGHYILEYAESHYPTQEGLALKIEMDNEYADIVMFIHRSDNTWRIIALDFCDTTIGYRGKIVSDEWMGWRMVQDKAQPERHIASDTEVNRMFRTRDRLASHYLLPWQYVYSFVMFQTPNEPSDTDENWYNRMILMGAGAMRVYKSKNEEIIAPELMKLFMQLIN